MDTTFRPTSVEASTATFFTAFAFCSSERCKFSRTGQNSRPSFLNIARTCSPMEAPRAASISATRRQARMPSFSGMWPRMVSPALSSPPSAILSSRINCPIYLNPTGVWWTVCPCDFAAASVQSVHDEFGFPLAQSIKVDQLLEPLQIIFSQVDPFRGRILLVRFHGWRHRKRAVFLNYFRYPRFNILGDFRKGWARVRRRKLQPVILRRIMACREIDRPVEFPAHDFERDGRRGREGFAEQRSNALLPEDIHRELRKFFGEKARIVANKNRRLLGFCFHVLRDGRHRQPHVGEGKLVGDHAAPARGAKLDG